MATGRPARGVEVGTQRSVAKRPRRAYPGSDRSEVPLAGARCGGERHANSQILRIAVGSPRWDSSKPAGGLAAGSTGSCSGVGRIGRS